MSPRLEQEGNGLEAADWSMSVCITVIIHWEAVRDLVISLTVD